MLLLALVGLLAAWTSRSGGRPESELALLAGVAAAYVAGRLLGSTRVTRSLTCLALAAAVTASVLGSADGLSGTPLAGPLGYGNANGALCTLGVGAALVAAFVWRQRSVQLLGLLAAAGLAYLAYRTGSAAATVLSAALVVLGAAVGLWPRCARLLPPFVALAVLGSVGLTVLLGLGGIEPEGVLGEALSSRRVVLWSEALDLARQEPVRGVGADEFSRLAPTAVADADARWAHSAWLQQSAETGLVGGLLLLAVGLGAVLRPARSGPAGALGSLVVGAVLVQASVDYVLHFPAVTLMLAAVVGTSSATQRYLLSLSGQKP